MSAMRKITAFVPADLLEEAQSYTGEGVTETLRQGLQKLRHARACKNLLALEGKVFIDFDKGTSRDDRDLDW